MVTASDSFDIKARHVRALYRKHSEAGGAIVKAEYERIFPDREIRLDQILVSAWKEGRELAGWTYDTSRQAWHRADGSLVVEDDGREWLPA